MGILIKKDMKVRNLLVRLFAVAALLSSWSCFAVEHLSLATTTSTENSGLLAVLNPVFEQKYNVKVDVIAVGTGKALKIGSHGDVDVVLVHAPEAELKYVEQGDFIDRQPVMHNDFVIIGPKNDPAGLAKATSVGDSLKKIVATQSRFVSRGDDSGTHKKELALWQLAECEPEGNWYIKAGQGMGSVIKMADEMQAYTLSDRGTYIAFRDKVELEILYEQSPPLFNPYHIMSVNPEKHPSVNYALATQYIAFLVGLEGQAIINDFKLKGEQLFYPNAK
jgi:tungstate transport system substrate-binding protein